MAEGSEPAVGVGGEDMRQAVSFRRANNSCIKGACSSELIVCPVTVPVRVRKCMHLHGDSKHICRAKKFGQIYGPHIAPRSVKGNLKSHNRVKVDAAAPTTESTAQVLLSGARSLQRFTEAIQFLANHMVFGFVDWDAVDSAPPKKNVIAQIRQFQNLRPEWAPDLHPRACIPPADDPAWGLILRQAELHEISAKRLAQDGVFDICEFALPGVHPHHVEDHTPIHWKWFEDAFHCGLAILEEDSTDLRFFTSLMIIAAIRDQRFAGIAVDCICGRVIDVYTHMAAIRKACRLGALPEDALEELFHRSTQNRYREGARNNGKAGKTSSKQGGSKGFGPQSKKRSSEPQPRATTGQDVPAKPPQSSYWAPEQVAEERRLASVAIREPSFLGPSKGELTANEIKTIKGHFNRVGKGELVDLLPESYRELSHRWMCHTARVLLKVDPMRKRLNQTSWLLEIGSAHAIYFALHAKNGTLDQSIANILYTPIAMSRLGHRLPKQRVYLLESLGIPREEKVREILDERANEFYLHRLFQEQNLNPSMKAKIDLAKMAKELDYVGYVYDCHQQIQEEWLKKQPSCIVSAAVLDLSMETSIHTLSKHLTPPARHDQALRKFVSKDSAASAMPSALPRQAERKEKGPRIKIEALEDRSADAENNADIPEPAQAMDSSRGQSARPLPESDQAELDAACEEPQDVSSLDKQEDTELESSPSTRVLPEDEPDTGKAEHMVNEEALMDTAAAPLKELGSKNPQGVLEATTGRQTASGSETAAATADTSHAPTWEVCASSVTIERQPQYWRPYEDLVKQFRKPRRHLMGYEADKLRHVEAKQWKAAGVIPYIFSEKDNELLILFGLVKVPNTNQREIYPLGGKRDRSDVSAEATAVRELTEESGGLLSGVNVGPFNLRKVVWLPSAYYATYFYKAPAWCINLPEQYQQLREKYGPRMRRSHPVKLAWLPLSTLDDLTSWRNKMNPTSKRAFFMHLIQDIMPWLKRLQWESDNANRSMADARAHQKKRQGKTLPSVGFPPAYKINATFGTVNNRGLRNRSTKLSQEGPSVLKRPRRVGPPLVDSVGASLDGLPVIMGSMPTTKSSASSLRRSPANESPPNTPKVSSQILPYSRDMEGTLEIFAVRSGKEKRRKEEDLQRTQVECSTDERQRYLHSPFLNRRLAGRIHPAVSDFLPAPLHSRLKDVPQSIASSLFPAAAVNYVPAAPDGSDGFAVSEEEMIQIWQPRASWRSKHDQ